jgi:energy-coupling factor transporter ATP-binding protein EcfA2
MATHDSAIVNELRQRVIELKDDKVVRDAAHAIYQPDLTTDSGKPERVGGTMAADGSWEPDVEDDFDPSAGYEGGA